MNWKILNIRSGIKNADKSEMKKIRDDTERKSDSKKGSNNDSRAQKREFFWGGLRGIDWSWRFEMWLFT